MRCAGVHLSMDFVRETRLPVPPMDENTVVIDAPPQVPSPVPPNPLARLLPVAMLVAAVGMMAVYFTSGGQSMRHPMLMFFPVMMLTSVLGTLMYGARGASTTAEVNRNRQRYLDYLDGIDQAAVCTAEAQRESLRWRHPEPGALWTLAGSRRMWERLPGDSDFGVIRVGTGARPLSTVLVEAEVDGAVEQDPVTVTAMRRLIRDRSIVTDVPLTLTLSRFSSITVDGDRHIARAFLSAVICQLAVLHGPDHVGIEADPYDYWDWLKWLPHHRQSPQCAVKILDQPAGLVLKSVASLNRDATQDLHLRVCVEKLVVCGRDGDDVIAKPDLLSEAQASACARRLARYRLGQTQAQDWMDLMAVRDLDTHWKATGDGHIRPVPIGVTHDGSRVQLDINEAARNGMGPHGLCVGATGSGKSELLRTLALGMIMSHSPDALNLILVDFKGGATFFGLERANHVAAVITNLAGEAHLVSRMNDALSGEMNRRQELLRAAGRFANLTEYQRARAERANLPPLPALFILVDEFSELLSQHPEFAELFVAIGRLGRSLGMHLLLASQRLDEGRLRGLETHLSYRICLKTFSAGESRSVLGVPDAYTLPSTPGAAFLKTASGDLVQFQTAFVSGPGSGRPSLPASTTLSEVPRARLFTAATESNPDDAAQHHGRTVLDTMLDRVGGRGAAAHQVWLPPLSESPALEAMATKTGHRRLTVPVGVVDNPYEQRRDPLVVELDGPAGNVAIVGAPRSGKSTALRTLLLALAERHAPTDVGFYCLDFGGGALSALRNLPHVGSMAGRADGDLCRRTVAVVASVVRKREAQFRRLGIDSMAAYRSQKGDDAFGDVFLVIDGWATLRQEFDALEGAITALAAQGLSFGVHVVITASRWAELRPALKDQIATRIELRLGDPAESEMDRKRARDLCGRPPGRGITRNGREFAIALPAQAVHSTAERLRDRWAPSTAPVVELLPTRLPRADLEVDGVLLGIGERELAAVVLDFAAQQHLLVLGDAGCGKTAVLRLLCRELVRHYTADEVQLEIVDFRRTLLGVVESEHLSGYAMAPTVLASRLPAIIDRLQARMPGENVTQAQLRTRSWWSGAEIYLVIDDYDLVAGATGNPLAPLADLLPHATDIGLHVLVARRSGGAARAMFDPVLARMRELCCTGLMMSAGPEEGVLLGSVRPSVLPPGRGTLIARGDPDQLVQVAWTDPP